jgi:hypothetical protein
VALDPGGGRRLVPAAFQEPLERLLQRQRPGAAAAGSVGLLHRPPRRAHDRPRLLLGGGLPRRRARRSAATLHVRPPHHSRWTTDRPRSALFSLVTSISCSLSGRHKNIRVKKREARGMGDEGESRRVFKPASAWLVWPISRTCACTASVLRHVRPMFGVLVSFWYSDGPSPHGPHRLSATCRFRKVHVAASPGPRAKTGNYPGDNGIMK